MRLVDIKEIKGKIKLKTGLHIGSGDTEMRIGGTDQLVISHPFRKEPYIPGSSLKGKIRSLLELKSGLMRITDGAPLSIKTLRKANNISAEEKRFGEKIIKLFGTSGAEGESIKEYGPTRASFSDCEFTEEVREKIKKGEMVATEIKAENSINRITSTALNPRFIERVPAGIEFKFSISLKIFDVDDKEDLIDFLLMGMKLLEMDALGGNGSRGYGRIKFCFDGNEDLKQKFKKIEFF